MLSSEDTELLALAKKWKGYWKSEVTKATPEQILIRGYSLTDLTGNIGYAEALYLIIKRELPDRPTAEVLEAILTGIIDHGFRNTIGVAARFVVSANPDPLAGIAAGILAIGRHTAGAQKYVCRFINESWSRMETNGWSVAEAATRISQECVDNRLNVPGFGSLLRKELGYDPRSVRLLEIVKQVGLGDGPKLQLFLKTHEEFQRIKGKRIVLNIDGMQGAVLTQLGFDELEIAALEAAVMLPSLIGQALEEIKSGVPLRIIPEIISEVSVEARPFPDSRRRK